MGDDYAKEIQAIDKGNKMGFREVFSEAKESEKVREKNAKQTSQQILQDGGSAKAPEDSMHLSDDAKEERGLKDSKESKKA
jgi:hypothetical protein